LYVAARFSDRPVGEGHRRQAAEALEHSLASLRVHRRHSAGARVDAGAEVRP
jgi:hypothetical protein